MNIEEELAVSLLKGIISGKQWVFPSRATGEGLNWKRFKEFISYHELHAYLFPLIKNSLNLFPTGIIDFFKNNYFYYLAHGQRLLREYSCIAAAFSQAKIRVVPLKGIAFLQDIYFHLPARPMADIDLLIEKINLPAASGILFKLGFTRKAMSCSIYKKDSQRSIAFGFTF
jgi:hypothetical protein